MHNFLYENRLIFTALLLYRHLFSPLQQYIFKTSCFLCFFFPPPIIITLSHDISMVFLVQFQEQWQMKPGFLTKFPHCFASVPEWLLTISLCPHSNLGSLFKQFYNLSNTVSLYYFSFMELPMVIWNIIYHCFLVFFFFFRHKYQQVYFLQKITLKLGVFQIQSPISLVIQLTKQTLF